MSDERPFIKVADALADHPKFIALDDDAAAFMVVAMWGYCHHQNTDGRIPKAKAHRITKAANVARCQKAVRVGLIEESGDDYVCHDYLDHQQSAEQRAEVSQKRSVAGRAGGLARAKQVAKQVAGTELSKTQAEVEVEVEVEKEHPPVASLPDRFSDFWAVYPRRIARGAAVKAWRTATKKSDPEAILTAARAFAASVRGSDQKFIPHPASWLNAERWADEPQQLRAVPSYSPQAAWLENM